MGALAIGLVLVGCEGAIAGRPAGAAVGGGEGSPGTGGGVATAAGGGAGSELCTDTWESYGQQVFADSCVSCHTHNHSNFSSVEVVRGELELIRSKVAAGLMPLGAPLPAEESKRLLAFLACGAPGKPAVPPDDAQPVPPRVAVAKVKALLVGLPPSDQEVQAVTDDPAALEGLIQQWMTLPQYATKMQRFFELAFQQTQITSADLVDFLKVPGGPGALVTQNLTESFARTVLALDAEGRPLTEAFTTRRVMMTPAMMELYAFLDAYPSDNEGRERDTMPPSSTMVTLTSAGPIPIEQSVDPASPNYMRWYNPNVGNLNYPTNPTCNTNPIVMPMTSLGLHYVMYGGVPGRPRPGLSNCPNRGGSTAAMQLRASDFTTWKMVTLRRPVGSEKPTRFYDLPALRTATELVGNTPRVGFFSTPAFHGNWQTNDSNQMRVTLNQALIVATGKQVDGLDSTPSPTTPGMDAEHSSSADCSSCHRLLDPTRAILSSTWSWNYGPQTDASLIAEKGRFQFQGLSQSVSTLEDFAQALAKHPQVPVGWAQKLCTAANSQRCDESDPEFQRVVQVFKASNLSWSVLVRTLLSSPLVTHMASKPVGGGEVIAVARRDQLCASLNARLQLNDACGSKLVLGSTSGVGLVPKIVGGLPSDGYGRGATEPVLPNTPTLFYRAALENICVAIARQVIDAPASANHPNARRWASTSPIGPIVQDFTTLLVGLAPSDPRRAAIAAALEQHFNDADVTQSKSDALKSTFVAACLSPTFIGVGL